MADKNKYPGIDPRITRIIAQQVGKLAGRYGTTFADLDEIEQDLHVKVEFSYLNPLDLSFERHVQQIVNHAVIDKIRWLERECRDWRRVVFSLNDVMPDGDDQDESRGDVMDLVQAFDAGFGRPVSWHERREMAMDLEDGLSRLPGELRDLAETLAACGGNLSEAARDLGISRKMARIRFARLQQEMVWLRKL